MTGSGTLAEQIVPFVNSEDELRVIYGQRCHGIVDFAQKMQF